MKTFLLVLAILSSALAAHAQSRIDSMKIVTESSSLEIYGEFAAEGSVTVEDISLPVTSWSNSLIVCTIQDTGRGSAGAVIVSSEGQNSEPKNITLWEGSWSQDYVERHSRDIGNAQSLQYRVRLDLHDAILHQQRYSRYALDSSSIVRVVDYSSTPWSPKYGYETNWRTESSKRACEESEYDAGFRGMSALDLLSRNLGISVSEIRGVEERITWMDSTGQGSEINVVTYPGFAFSLPLNEKFNPMRIDTFWYPFGNDRTVGSRHAAGTVHFLPPDSLLSLASKPEVKPSFVMSNSVAIGWSAMMNVLDYEIELSNEVAFINPIISRTTADSVIVLSINDPARYYLRVRGRNQYGSTAWAPTKQFDFLPASVETEKVRNGLRMIEDRLTNHSEQPIACRVYDLLGRKQAEFKLEPMASVRLAHLTRPMLVIVHGRTHETMLVP
jgi:hypothetical protein